MARWRAVLVAGLLAAAVLGAFSSIWPAGFVDYDDQAYVTSNPHVLAGLSLRGIQWATTAVYIGNYHPLTNLSLMLDGTMGGADPLVDHLHNILLHALAAVLLFEALRRMTGRTWVSALAAGLWALYPRRVESVAWVSERKDVLSGALGAGVLLAYAVYAHRPSAARYALVVVLFVLGLLAKPVLVTLPLALLLLDYWPLRRGAGWVRLLVEKIPLIALSAGSSMATVLAQKHGQAVSDLAAVPMSLRLGNAVVAYLRYLGKTIFPHDLVYLYPLPEHVPTGWIIVAAVTLVVVTIITWIVRRRAPYLLVGWLWFLGTLVPMIGLVQVGRQSMADRYTYWPSIGLCMATAWGGAEVARRARLSHGAAVGIGLGLLLVLGGLTFHQALYWRDSESLFSHAVAVNPSNASAWRSLGNVRLTQGRLPAAADAYQRAVEIEPQTLPARNTLAMLFTRLGESVRAIDQYQAVLSRDGANVVARTNLTNLYNARGASEALRGELALAESDFRAALAVDPQSAPAHNNLGRILMLRGDRAGAAAQFQTALRLDPSLDSARRNRDELDRH